MPSREPATPPMTGTSQRLPRTNWRARKRLLQLTSPRPSAAPRSLGHCSAYEQSGPLSVDETDDASVCVADLMPSSASLTDASSGTASTAEWYESHALESWLVDTSLRSEASLFTASQSLWMESTADW